MRVFLLLILLVVSGAAPLAAQTRNAAFTNPNAGGAVGSGSAGKGMVANTVVADPASIDAGETLVNVARRITVFFTNGFRAPVQINDLTLNADGNVRSKVINDDCKTLKTLPVSDKCSIAIEVTPSSPGPWSVELLLNHSGQGRIARAEVTGSTMGKADEKSEGLAISKKIAAPLDFGDMKPNVDRAARTMLIENDSAEKLIISKIDLISDDEGLTLRTVGCKEGDELKPGESCPVTVMWAPVGSGTVATDLIIRHSGNLGFVVVPIRGKAEDKDAVASGGDGKDGKSSTAGRSRVASRGGERSSAAPFDSQSSMRNDKPATTAQEPPSVQDVVKALPPLKSTSMLPRGSLETGKRQAEPGRMAGKDAAAEAAELPQLQLIGTIGSRAILSDEEGQSHLLSLGDRLTVGGVDIELLQLDPSRAVISALGRREELRLRRSQSLMQSGAVGSEGGSAKVSPQPPAGKESSTGARPAVNTNTSGAGDGSPPASTSEAAPSGAPSSGASSPGASSSGAAGTLSVDDVLKMMN